MAEKLDRSKAIVRKYMYWSMGAGLIPVPYADMAAVTGVQIKMLADLAKHYEIPFSKNKVKEIVAALIGGALPGPIAGSMLGSAVKMVPVVGPIIGGVSVPLLSGATTYAVGNVFIRHFESGGNFIDFEPAKVKDEFKQEFEKGKTAAQEFVGKKAPEEEKVGV
jgi:uncharacterized protein (DUF697 family)